MTLTHQVDLRDGTLVTVEANWAYCRGTPGTLSDAKAWDVEIVTPLSPHDRRHVMDQLLQQYPGQPHQNPAYTP